MRITIFGAGSLGSLVGGLLAREHDVVLVGRDPHVSRSRDSGLTIDGELATTVQLDARRDVPDRVGLAVICVKAFDTTTAAEALSGTDIDACLSLQNGLGNEATLADQLAVPVLAGTCTYGALLESPGTVTCTGRGTVVLGARDGGSLPLADRVGDAFATAGLDVTVAEDMPRRLWEKLAVNAGINATTALARVDNGVLCSDDGNAVATAAARETAAVARATGIDLPTSTAVEATERVAATTAANVSSMRQDVRDGRRTEVDAINGYVVDKGDELGVETPTNRTLCHLLRAWERGRGLRP